MQNAICQLMAMHQQDATVPHRRFLSAQCCKIGINLDVAFVRKRPGLRHKGEVQSIDAGYRRVAHGVNASAWKTRLGLAISSCAATSRISRAPASEVFASTPKTADSANDNAPRMFPLR